MFNSKAVSSIRLIALSMIVTCHIFQGEDMVLAWWFNVGVQIFLFMSGFLFGTKNIDDAAIWIKKRITRIIVPYYILLAIVIVFYLVFAKNLLTVSGLLTNLLLLQGFGTGLAGIEHLWFISYILMCYLITPILQAADFANPKNTKWKYIIKLILLLAALQILNLASVINVSIPNVGAYIIGYYFSRRHFYYEKYQGLAQSGSMRRSVIGIFAACILTTPLVVYLTYFYNGSLFSFLVPYKDGIFAWNHTLLGVTLFLAMYFLFDCLYRKKPYKPLDHIIRWSDRYSYHVYLTHQIFILGQFSLLFITINKFFNIAIILLCAILTGIVLEKLNRLVLNKLEQHHQKSDSSAQKIC